MVGCWLVARSHLPHHLTSSVPASILVVAGSVGGPVVASVPCFLRLRGVRDCGRFHVRLERVCWADANLERGRSGVVEAFARWVFELGKVSVLWGSEFRGFLRVPSGR